MLPTLNLSRNGILAAGNFIVDHVKMIDYYPGEEMLATIASQTSGNGGGPYNILKDLAKMGAPFPLEAAGLLGRDAAAQWIQADCVAHGISTTDFRYTDHGATSYTDAFTVTGTGRRTFFHQPGTNAQLAPEHFDFSRTNARLFFLGYLLLLDTLDLLRPDGSTGAADVLQAASAAGLVTAVDCVSKQHPDYGKIVAAALPHTDLFISNEVECGRILGRDLQQEGKLDVAAATEACRELLAKGVRQAVVIHAIEGAVAVTKDGAAFHQRSLQVPAEAIQGATGAGDAFAAGFLYAWHEGKSMPEALQWSVAAAACCLSHPTTSDGMKPLQECLELITRYGIRPS
jgi:sugar/nucleoside kinase (ribokinase family)